MYAYSIISSYMESFPILPGSNTEARGDCLVFIGEHVSSVPHHNGSIILKSGHCASQSSKKHFHPQETFLLLVMCAKVHRNADEFLHLRSLTDDEAVVN